MAGTAGSWDGFIQGLIALLRRPGAAKRARPPTDVRVDAGKAPPSVRALVDALATASWRADLGEFSVWAGEPRVETLAGRVQHGQEGAELDDITGLLAKAGPDGLAFDPAASLFLADDGGGMSALGLAWAGERVWAVLVELEDPTADNLVRAFATPAALIDKLVDLDEEAATAPDLEALRAAAGLASAKSAPPTPGPAKVLADWTGAPPPHPAAPAQAHFGQRDMVFALGPTAGGRLVMWRRIQRTPPPKPTEVVVRAADGTLGTLPYDPSGDVFGMALVPGRERALVCAGFKGPLLELDLTTGASRELLAKAGWTPGFVDGEHLVVLGEGALHVYRLGEGPLGEPVASVPTDVFNIFVASGFVFGKTRDPAFALWRWTGAALEPAGVHAFEGQLFALHAEVTVDGQRLVGGIDTKGAVRWLAFTPPAA